VNFPAGSVFHVLRLVPLGRNPDLWVRGAQPRPDGAGFRTPTKNRGEAAGPTTPCFVGRFPHARTGIAGIGEEVGPVVLQSRVQGLKPVLGILGSLRERGWSAGVSPAAMFKCQSACRSLSAFSGRLFLLMGSVRNWPVFAYGSCCGRDVRAPQIRSNRGLDGFRGVQDCRIARERYSL
jgi:hypothetical protein